jgi:hypothetical protein
MRHIAPVQDGEKYDFKPIRSAKSGNEEGRLSVVLQANAKAERCRFEISGLSGR